MATREEIIAQFEKEMLNAYYEPIPCYTATAFFDMLYEKKAIITALTLLDTPEVHSGLFRLYDCNKLHCSVEAIILRPEYRIPDFAPTTPERRARARKKLYDNFGYTAKWDDGK